MASVEWRVVVGSPSPLEVVVKSKRNERMVTTAATAASTRARSCLRCSRMKTRLSTHATAAARFPLLSSRRSSMLGAGRLAATPGPPASAVRSWSSQSRNTALICCSLQADVLAEGKDSESEKVLENLKELVKNEGGNSEGVDDRELLRFLRNASFDAAKAAKSFSSHQKWLEEFVPKGYFVESDLQEELDAKKAYWISQDKKGRPAIFFRGRNHYYNANDFDQFRRFVVYAFQRLIREAPPGAEQFISIVDMQGLGLKNLDAKSFIVAFEILQKHFPQQLDKVFLVNVPLIFNGVWRVVKNFIQEDTKKLVVFVGKNQLVETLTSEIDIEFLPKDCGGTAELVPLQDAVTPNWPPSS